MGNSTICSKIIYTRLPEQELLKWIEKYTPGKVFLATEETVNDIWVAKFDDFLNSNGIKKITIQAGQNNKKLNRLQKSGNFSQKTAATVNHSS